MTGLLLALDVASIDLAVDIAIATEPHVSGYKVGLELLLGPDPHSVEKIVEIGLPVFVDAKLHDIPATVEHAARQLGKRGARWVTVHASGGTRMLSAGVAGLEEGSGGSGGVLAVTVLTSLDRSDLESIGAPDGVESQTRRLIQLAADSGAEGVISSVHEAPLVRSMSNLLIVTPGIRPAGADKDDQKRTATPTEAARVGASYVVVGRPITGAVDIAEAARDMANELSAPLGPSGSAVDG